MVVDLRRNGWWRASATTPHQGGGGRARPGLLGARGHDRPYSPPVDGHRVAVGDAIRFAWECLSQGVALGQGDARRTGGPAGEGLGCEQGWREETLIGIRISDIQRIFDDFTAKE